MIEYDVYWETFDEAVQGILKYFVEHQRDTRVIYFDGWRGFGASAVLRAVADELTTRGAWPELHINKVIHIDCSMWKSRRAMQRAIAVELKLDYSVIEIIDKTDEDDDFKGVEEDSRNEIMSVAEVINRALRDLRFIFVFHNGSGEYIDLDSFGIPSFTVFGASLILWTFRRRFQGTEEIKDKVKNTHLFAYETSYDITRNELLFPVLQKEVAAMAAHYPCMREIDQDRIMHCCLYGLFLYLCLPKHLENEWAARASTYWVCDGIIQGDRAWEISHALSKEIKWDLHPSLLNKVRGALTESSSENSICFQRLKGTYFNENKMAYPRIAISTSNTPKTLQNIKAINTNDVSSYFLAPDEISDNVLLVLADGLFDLSTNLRVLQLSHCAFSFASPPFIGCQNLRFLGLDHCKDNETTEQIDPRKWQFLHSLWVLNLLYTGWYQVFSKEVAHLIINLGELNIVGPECWQYIGELQGQLPDVHRLRIVKSMDQPKATTYVGNHLIEQTKLEILDLSGNTYMTSLPTNLSKARRLQVLVLDGCHGLENIVSDGLPPSLRSVSFDGYGPATKWASSVELPTRDASLEQVVKHIKTSVISFKGCIRLENLFLRELPNLVELDLSGTAIKILDFTSMVVEVSCLKRLFLLGCKQLQAIKWDISGSRIKPYLKLLCVDTRSRSKYPQLFVDKNKSRGFLSVHAVIVDARIARSLFVLSDRTSCDDINIHVTSSTIYGEVQSEGTYKHSISQIRDHVNMQQQDLRSAGQYHDVQLSMVGDVPMQSFPLPPTTVLSRHIEIAQGSHNLESELDADSPIPTLAHQVNRAMSLHVHDLSTITPLPGGRWWYLTWCRIERCSKIETVFPKDAWDFDRLETAWVSDLLMARCIWSKGSRGYRASFINLQHLHLRSCPRLQFVLPVWVSSFPNLETLHVIHCSNLHNIFVLDGAYPEQITVEGVAFPKLTTIHLHDLPMLRQICDVEFKMVAPVLETIKIRGCWGLRRLPAVAARGPKPAVEIEKDVWDALEWDGVEANHHHSLFQAPVHSRYYKKKLPRGSVLR